MLQTPSLVSLAKLDNAYHGWCSKVTLLSKWGENKHEALKCIPVMTVNNPPGC